MASTDAPPGTPAWGVSSMAPHERIWRWINTSVQSKFYSAAKPSVLHCAVCLVILAWLGGIGAVDAANSKTLTLLPPLSANATTRDVFLNSSSQIQLCVSCARPEPRRASRSLNRPAPIPNYVLATACQPLTCMHRTRCTQLCLRIPICCARGVADAAPDPTHCQCQHTPRTKLTFSSTRMPLAGCRGSTSYRMVGSQSSGWSSNATALMLQAMATAFNAGEHAWP